MFENFNLDIKEIKANIGLSGLFDDRKINWVKEYKKYKEIMEEEFKDV